MAMADYRLCDVCGGKAFYDANLNYDFDRRNPVTGEPKLDYLGDWGVLCIDCSKTHKVVILKRGENNGGDGASGALGDTAGQPTATDD